MWIARDETGGIHEANFETLLFVVICDPYENELGQRMIDLLEGGQVYECMEASHVDYWSTLVNE
jgi:hypothetical protein